MSPETNFIPLKWCFEPLYEKLYLLIYAPSENSEQPVYIKKNFLEFGVVNTCQQSKYEAASTFLFQMM